MKIKILSMLLICLFALVIMVSCGDNEKDKSSNIDLSATLDFLSHVEREDMGGYEFRILTRKGKLKTQVVDEENGELINDAVFRRNKTIEEYFNIKIVGTEGSGDAGSDALNMILAGDDAFDLLLPHSRTSFNYAVQGAAVNFLDIKTIDLSKEWWASDIIASCEIGGRLYVLDGDISLDGIGSAAAMFFNKRIFDELGLEYPYQMVLDGEWTFDEFSKLVKLGGKDLNGDGIIKPETDQYGFSTDEWLSPISVLYSGGQRIYTKSANGIPKLSLNSPKTVKIFSDFFTLTSTDDVFLHISGRNDVTQDLFTSGRAMFSDGILATAEAKRSMYDEFGILPFPKYSKEDEYGTIVNGTASLLVVPITVDDVNKTGKIIEALCAVGSNDVVPAYYDTTLKTKFSRDYESEEMIDIIRDTRVYDLGYISGGEFQSVGRDIAALSNKDFASYYASRESAALSDLETFINSYTK